jgi:hypothetical protein
VSQADSPTHRHCALRETVIEKPKVLAELMREISDVISDMQQGEQ